MYDTTQTAISDDQIREELKLLLQSRPFQQSNRLARFLKFTVEHTLTGKLEDLKEYTIGVEVYDRGTSFSPSLDSIVRGEARRLRGKLKEYYEGEGKDRPIFIYYRLGSYAPLFQRNESQQGTYPLAVPRHALSRDAPKPIVAVVPFRDLSNTSASLALASGITDELTHLLTTIGAYRVVAPSRFSDSLSQGVDTQAIATRLGVEILLEGSVMQEKENLRITSSLVDGEGFQLTSYRFEATGDAEKLFVVQETIASDLANRLSHFLDKYFGSTFGPRPDPKFANLNANENGSAMGTAQSSSLPLKVVGVNLPTPTRIRE